MRYLKLYEQFRVINTRDKSTGKAIDAPNSI